MQDKSTKKSSPGARPARPVRRKLVQTHEIRIIGGQWKRTKLKVADKPGLRPTPDR
ncbi:MAG: rRNA ((966)-N(2))-methyltransferase RsmD, partial [Pseudomonadota bacterium]